ncbi:hypothetical protein KDH_58030 [Dictyobacter sp. S3.2.2.5]|uniref:Uncharacterized protein n=1 Tax=Dictyobacter halimunensis TaxID=3026934 RepID=A0ABQ6FXH0_9CHLR|nr:hypothetical protein KDH_58030 [Dictyobacter sp. S3.2.2.5]
MGMEKSAARIEFMGDTLLYGEEENRPQGPNLRNRFYCYIAGWKNNNVNMRRNGASKDGSDYVL